MATKYPENVNYDIQSRRESNRALLDAVREARKTGAPSPLAPSASRSSIPSFGFAGAAPRARDPLDDFTPEERREAQHYARTMADSGVPIAESLPQRLKLSQYEKTLGAPYGTFRDPGEVGYAQKAGYLRPGEFDPSELTFLTDEKRGGVLLVDPNTGKPAFTQRPDHDWSVNQLRRQGLDPKLYEIDHIIPLWAGGADVEANMEIMTKRRHDQKTALQSVALTLMAQGDITWEEAMPMIANWKEFAERKDTITPDLLENGLVDYDVAKELASRWKTAPKLSFFDKLKKGQLVPGSKGFAEDTSMLAEILFPKSKQASAVPREFTKGLTSGLLPPINFLAPELMRPGEWEKPSTQRAANISYMAGAIIGNIASFVAVYGAVSKAMGAVGLGVRTAKTGKSAIPIVSKFLGKKTVKKVAKESAMNTAKEALTANTSISKEMIRRSSGLGRRLYDVAPRALTLGGVSVALGQARPMYEYADKQTGEIEEQSRAARAAYDFFYAALSPVGSVGHSARAYMSVASPAFVVSLMEGLNHEDSFANAVSFALMNTGTMVGVHGLGHLGYKTGIGPFKSPPASDKALATAKMTKGIWGAVDADSMATKISVTSKEVKKGGDTISNYFKTKSGKKGIATMPIEQEIKVWQPQDKKTGRTDMMVKAQAIEKKATELSLETRKNYWTMMQRDVKSGKFNAAEAKKYNLDLSGDDLAGIRKGSYRVFKSEAQLEVQNKSLKEYFKWKVIKEGLSEQEYKILASRIDVSGRQIFNSGLPVKARTTRQIQDVMTLTKRVLSDPYPNDLTTPYRFKWINAGKFKKAPEPGSAYYKKADFDRMPPSEQKRMIKLYGESGMPPNGEGLVMGLTMVGEGDQANMMKFWNAVSKGEIGSNRHIDADTGRIAGKKIEVRAMVDRDGNVFLPIGDKKIARVGALAKEESVHRHNQNIFEREARGAAESGKVPDALTTRPLDPEINVDRIRGYMDKTGVDVIELTAIVNPPRSMAPAGSKIMPENSFYMGLIFNDNTFSSENIARTKNMIDPSRVKKGAPGEGVKKTLREVQNEKVNETLNKVASAEPAVVSEGVLDNYISKNAYDPESFGVKPVTPKAKIKIDAETPISPKKLEDKKGLLDEGVSRKGPVVKDKKKIAGLAKEAEAGKTIPEAENTSKNKISPTDRAEDVEAKISSKHFREFGEDSVVKGVSTDIDQKISKTPELTKKQTEGISKIKNMVSKENFEKDSKLLVKKYKGNEDKAFERFVKDLNTEYKKAGIETPFGMAGKKGFGRTQSLKSFFKARVQSEPTTSFRITGKFDPKTKKMQYKKELVVDPSRPSSYMTKTLGEINSKEGTNLTFVKAQIDDTAKNIGLKDLKNSFVENNIVPFGYSDNSPNSLFGITYDPKKAGGKKISEKGAMNEFFANVLKDMGIETTGPNKIARGTLNKRWKEVLFSEYIPQNDSGKVNRVHVIDQGNIPGTDLKINDGATFRIIGDMNKQALDGGSIVKGNNYTSKSVLNWKNKDGTLNVIKNQEFGVVEGGPLHKKLESIIREKSGNKNFKFEEGDVVTSIENVKIGKNILNNFGKNKNNYHLEEVPLSARRAKYDLPKYEDEVYKFSMYLNSFLGKNDGVNKAISSMYKKPVQKYNNAWSDVMSAKTSKEALESLDKHKEIFRGALGENAYGLTKKKIENGAWGYKGSDLWNEVDDVMTNGFRNYILAGKFLPSSYSKLMPDLGLFLKNGKRTFIPKDTIMMSEKHWKSLGEPSRVMAGRHPVVKRSGLLSLKVAIAEKHGIKDMGNSVSMNAEVGYKDLYFDFDGDALSLFAVRGKKGGVPNKIADRLEVIYKKDGGKVPKETKKMTGHEDGDITIEGMLEVGERAVQGGIAVGENTNMRTILQGVVDNKESLGGWTLKDTSPKGIKEMFSYIEFLNNASTDSPKMQDLWLQLKKNDSKNVTDLLRNKFFNPPKGVSSDKAIKDFRSRLDTLLIPVKYANVDKTIPSRFPIGKQDKMSLDFAKYKKDVASKRTAKNPIDTIVDVVDTLPRYPTLNAADQTAIHKTRIIALNNKIKDGSVVLSAKKDKKVEEILLKFTKSKKEAEIASSGKDKSVELEIKKKFKDDFNDYYLSRQSEFTPEQKNRIAYWMLHSDEANLADWGKVGKYKNSFQTRMDAIIHESPDIAKAYYGADIGDFVPTTKGIGTDTVTAIKKAIDNVPKVDATDKTLKIGSTVKYKGNPYLVHGKTSSGAAKLIKPDGTKFSGTPLPDKINVTGKLPTVKYQGKSYIPTTKGDIFSVSTGNKIVATRIITPIIERYPGLKNVIKKNNPNLFSSLTKTIKDL